ncbi:lysophospholipid acyltransferase family protein [Amylibacter marinus]|nr:lysophospholipid acyltransferase family protein [Amylibacter marinus]
MRRPTALGWVALGLRVVAMAVVIFGLFGPMFLARRLGARNLAQSIVRVACRISVGIIGLRVSCRGAPMQHAGAVVANHGSWIDILTLNAVQKIYFVSKDEVEGWPLVGALARGIGTVFIRRKRTDAALQKQVFLDRISSGDRLLFFPEGTSTDGKRVLPFKPTLFAAFFEPELAALTWIQPVTVNYLSPRGQRDDFYGWWGDMDFVEAFVMVVGSLRQGRVEIIFHAPLKVTDFKDRKALAQQAETIVRQDLTTR